jgi:CheY-like chemotaxis protein
MRLVKDSTAALSIDEARRLGRLILIAEDDEVNQLMIHQQIQTLGYAAVIVNNGAKAYKAWREGRYSLLLTDLNMPEMDGYSLAAAIRRHETNSPAPEKAHLPILALTSNARDDSEIHARAAGMDDYLTKPIRLRSLKVALRKWLPLDGPNAMQTEMQKEF